MGSIRTIRFYNSLSADIFATDHFYTIGSALMLMHTSTLYITTVLIWGSTFFAIKFQLGVVPTEVSIAYRFALAAFILLVWCHLKKLPMRFRLSQHFWMMTQGLTLFGLNYMVVYWAAADITSGLIAVVFSTIILMNIANGALFFGSKTTPSVLAGALIGFVGICMIFLPEFLNMNLENTIWKGLLFSILGTFIASLGNMVSTHNQKSDLPVIQTNAYSMAYGAIALALLAWIQGTPFNYEVTWSYTGSLIYLALFGSVFAFGSYLTLLGRIGADRAAYSMVLFPIVSLGISSLLEGYRWSPESSFGICLVFIGNIFIVTSREHLNRLSQQFQSVWRPGQ